MPAITALTAVTLTLAAPSFAITSASAPTRSSPSIRNAVFGFESLILAFFAAAVNAVASEGTKSTCALRALGKACSASRLTPALRSARSSRARSEEHTSELQSRLHLVCRLLLEKKTRSYVNSASRFLHDAIHTPLSSVYAEP